MIYLKNCAIDIIKEDNARLEKVIYFLAAENITIPVNRKLCIVMVYPYEWSYMMTPWVYDGLGNEQTGGGTDFAAYFISELIEEIDKRLGYIPKYRGIAGYSLGGLEAFYIGLSNDIFRFAGSVSGSMWYPKAAEYFCSLPIGSNIERIYISLGSRERKTKDPLRGRILELTEQVASSFSKYTEVTYEINPGGHFTEIGKRITNCINSWDYI